MILYVYQIIVLFFSGNNDPMNLECAVITTQSEKCLTSETNGVYTGVRNKHDYHIFIGNKAKIELL